MKLHKNKFPLQFLLASRIGFYNGPDLTRGPPIKNPCSIYLISSQTISDALCIYFQLPDPYFEIKLDSFTRVKGIRLLLPPDEATEAQSNITYRLMYSTNGCKWKIYGIRSYKDTSNVTEQVNYYLIYFFGPK